MIVCIHPETGVAEAFESVCPDGWETTYQVPPVRVIGYDLSWIILLAILGALIVGSRE